MFGLSALSKKKLKKLLFIKLVNIKAYFTRIFASTKIEKSEIEFF